jgi:hypothetical protein
MSRVQVRLIISGLILLTVGGSAAAQCAMCKASLAGDPRAVAAAHQINMAILLLAIPAIVIFAGFFVAMYRYRNSFRNSPPRDAFGPSGNNEPGHGKRAGFSGPAGPEWL